LNQQKLTKGATETPLVRGLKKGTGGPRGTQKFCPRMGSRLFFFKKRGLLNGGRFLLKMGGGDLRPAGLKGRTGEKRIQNRSGNRPGSKSVTGGPEMVVT